MRGPSFVLRLVRFRFGLMQQAKAFGRLYSIRRLFKSDLGESARIGVLSLSPIAAAEDESNSE
jgi:hypothetical protein